MKKKIELNKKSIKQLKLKLQPTNERKVAPATLIDPSTSSIDTPTGGTGCLKTNPVSTCW